jgi:hypothetical protein
MESGGVTSCLSTFLTHSRRPFFRFPGRFQLPGQTPFNARPTTVDECSEMLPTPYRGGSPRRRGATLVAIIAALSATTVVALTCLVVEVDPHLGIENDEVGFRMEKTADSLISLAAFELWSLSAREGAHGSLPDFRGALDRMGIENRAGPASVENLFSDAASGPLASLPPGIVLHDLVLQRTDLPQATRLAFTASLMTAADQPVVPARSVEQAYMIETDGSGSIWIRRDSRLAGF